jgi:hypothetical protein
LVWEKVERDTYKCNHAIYLYVSLSPSFSRPIINQVRIIMTYICMCLSLHLFLGLSLLGLLLVWEKVERDTYKCIAWLPLLGLLLVWAKMERDTYKCMAWLPLLGLLLVWEKVERDTYKCME